MTFTNARDFLQMCMSAEHNETQPNLRAHKSANEISDRIVQANFSSDPIDCVVFFCRNYSTRKMKTDNQNM